MNRISPVALPRLPALLAACAALTAIMAIAGCESNTRKTIAPASPPQTQVEIQSITPAATKRYQLRPGESSTQPKLIERQAPIYPPAEIALHLAKVSIRAKVMVDQQGNVSQVRIEDAEVRHYPAAFDEAVRAAVSAWRYSPLLFLRWRDEYNAHGQLVGSHQVAFESRPFSLDYEFQFTLHHGKPVVASTQATAQ